MHSPHGLESIDDRDRGNRERRARVDCGCYQHMSATVGNPPDTGPSLVNAGKRFSEGKCVPIILNLIPGIDMLPWLACAFPKSTVIKPQGRATEVLEKLTIPRHHDFFRVAPSTGHDDERHVSRCASRPCQHPLTDIPATIELYSFRHNTSSKKAQLKQNKTATCTPSDSESREC